MPKTTAACRTTTPTPTSSWATKTRQRWPVGTRVSSIPALLSERGVKIIGQSHEAPGGFGEYFLLTEGMTQVVPTDLPNELVSIADAVSVGWSYVKRASRPAADPPGGLAHTPPRAHHPDWRQKGRHMTSIDERLQELVDKQDITEVIYRYARSMDRLDAELGYSVFWPEATADYHEQMYQGTGKGFVDMCMAAHPGFLSHSHQFSNILITVDGDTATSETYGDVTLRRADADGRLIDTRNLGRYVDRWERRDGEWRIIERTYVHDFDASTQPGSDFQTIGARDRTDPSYFGA
jgi:hypothetical protein